MLVLKRVKYQYQQILAPTTYTNVAFAVYGRRAGGMVLVSFSGNGKVVVYPQPDSRTTTWNLNYSNKPALEDLDLDTAATLMISAYTSETDVVTQDYYTVAERYVIFKVVSASSGVYHRLYISNDGSTWTHLFTTNNTSAQTWIFKTTFRYLKLTVQNTFSSSYLSTLYELLAFDTAGGVFNRNIGLADGAVNYEGALSMYSICIEPSPGLAVSVFEKSVISDVDELELTSS